MDWKKIFLDLAKLAAGALYAWLVAKYPNFPLPVDAFVNLVVFFILTLLGIGFYNRRRNDDSVWEKKR